MQHMEKLINFSDDISDLNFLRMSIRDNYDKDKITYEKNAVHSP